MDTVASNVALKIKSEETSASDDLWVSRDTTVKDRVANEQKTTDARPAMPANWLTPSPGGQSKAKSGSVASSSTKRKCYRCDQCEKTFKNPSKLKLHLVVHSNDRPFKCDQCDKGFKTPHKLRRHITTVHTNERPFQCSQCGDYFKTQEY